MLFGIYECKDSSDKETKRKIPLSLLDRPYDNCIPYENCKKWNSLADSKNLSNDSELWWSEPKRSLSFLYVIEYITESLWNFCLD